MTKQTKRKFNTGFKAKVALEAIKNNKTLAQLNQQFDVNVITISKCKAEALEHLPSLFKGNRSTIEVESSPEVEKLFAHFGQLQVENDFFNKVHENWG